MFLHQVEVEDVVSGRPISDLNILRLTDTVL